MQPLARYPYDNVVTFGGCQDDFMLVVTSDTTSEPTSRRMLESERGSSEDSSGTTKLLFNAGKPQVRTKMRPEFKSPQKHTPTIIFSDPTNYFVDC
jgi:hypothetical protein